MLFRLFRHSAARLFTLPLLLLCSLTSLHAETLHLYAGAGLRQPVERIVERFQQETGHQVTVEYGGSGQILTRYQLTGIGDLFLPGSADYVDKLQQQGSVKAAFPLIRHIPVFAVRKDVAEREHIATTADLARSKLKIGMGDPQAIALGRSGELLLDATGHGAELRQLVVVRSATIKQLLLYLLQGEIDAAVIGRADTVKNQDQLLLLPSPAGAPEEVATLAILNSSKAPQIAEQLAGYFTSADGIRAFTDEGFLPLTTQGK